MSAPVQPGSQDLLLRDASLAGINVVIWAPAPSETANATGRQLAALGGDVRELDSALLDEDAAATAAGSLDSATVFVSETGAALRSGGLRGAVEGAWIATRALVVGHMIPAGYGKVLIVAPRPADGADAAAAGAALENLARTTSVEWARLGIRVVAIRPRDATSDAAIAQTVAYLASPAGDYFSGCVLDLGAATSPVS